MCFQYTQKWEYYASTLYISASDLRCTLGQLPTGELVFHPIFGWNKRLRDWEASPTSFISSKTVHTLIATWTWYGLPNDNTDTAPCQWSLRIPHIVPRPLLGTHAHHCAHQEKVRRCLPKPRVVWHHGNRHCMSRHDCPIALTSNTEFCRHWSLFPPSAIFWYTTTKATELAYTESVASLHQVWTDRYTVCSPHDAY